MKIQYGHILTLFAVVAAALGSSVEDVLSGLSNSDLDSILNDLDYFEYNGGKQDLSKSAYEYDYEPAEDQLPHLEARAKADETDVNDVPKTEPELSHENPARANTMLPAYCDPPNPCPLGYTAADGCIDDFENTSEFSRRYQATQKCICDSEHMFDCPEPEENSNRDRAAANILSGIAGLGELNGGGDENPYLGGQKLPIAAKKGHF